MIVAYAGPRAWSKLETSEEGELREDLMLMLRGLSPRVVVGSAASGTDLLLLEAAARLQIKRHVFVAGYRAAFRDRSVTDLSARWGASYDGALASAACVIETAFDEEDPETGYAKTTQAIHDAALALASPDEEVVVVVATRPDSEGSHTEDLARIHEASGGLTLRVAAPRARPAKDAFIAMPFGLRRDPDQGWSEYDSDATYHRILIPALLGHGYRPVRVDAEALLEIIDSKMIYGINAAAVLIADLATSNPNVMWELGVRHAWRRSGTIILAPEQARTPFDVARVPITRYKRSETSVADHESVEGVRSVRKLLDALDERRIDSPIFFAMPDLEEQLMPEPPPTGGLLERVSLATDLRDLHRLEELVSLSQAETAGARRVLLEQIGIGLLALGEHERAIGLLRPLADADPSCKRVRLHQRLCHALIRAPQGPESRDRLDEARQRLGRVAARSPSSETLGLLGSAQKAEIQLGLVPSDKLGQRLSTVGRTYKQGFALEPGDYYPGINAVAALRLRASHFDDPAAAATCRSLIPVVAFAVKRNGPPTGAWELLTLAELALHGHLLDGTESIESALEAYAAAREASGATHLASAVRQLKWFESVGDDAALINQVLGVLG